MFTIKELKETIESMRKVHKFNDDALMTFERDLPSDRVDIVSIHLEEDGVKICLEKGVEHEAL